MSDNQKIQATRLDGPVRITMPAAVAYDINAFQKSITTLVERLGCRTCFSGADCTFRLERELVINENLEISPWAGRVGAADPDGDPALKSTVYVKLSPEISYNIDRVQSAVAKIAGLLGCDACCSGFDIAFRQELEFILVNKDLNVQRVGRAV